MSTAVDAASLRVVIIDDTVDLRDLLRIALARGGMAVVGEAGDGLSGIEAVRTERPDVVLLDLSMPVMDGLQALPQIRELVPDAKIVVLSGFGASELTERALAAGADGYLQKGLSISSLLDYLGDITATPSVGMLARSSEAVRRSNGATRPSPAQTDVPTDAVPSDQAWGQVIERSPSGVIEVEASEPYRLVRLNAAARDLLSDGPLAPGTPMSQISLELEAALVKHAPLGDAEFQANTGVRLVHVSLRAADASVLIYLRPVSDEVGILRTAIATTAHEFRGPVGVLCGAAEMLGMVGEGELDPAMRTRLLDSVQRQARLLDNITADLLTAAQIQRGTLLIELRAVDAVAVIETLVQERCPEGVAIAVDDTRLVLADPLRLEQMIGNLLCNAHKYGQPPVRLRIRPCNDDPAFVCIDVQDNGPGVSPEFQPHLFDEFSRASGSAAPGTGLGLHVVHRLAQAHGGTVSYATTPGGGAMFTLRLKAAA